LASVQPPSILSLQFLLSTARVATMIYPAYNPPPSIWKGSNGEDRNRTLRYNVASWNPAGTFVARWLFRPSYIACRWPIRAINSS